MATLKKNLSLFVGVAFILSACGLQKMADNASLVNYKTQPDPLEKKGQDVSGKLLINFPVKYFHKKAILTITPVVRAENEELELKKFVLRGTSVTTNTDAQVIDNLLGGNVDHGFSFKYDEKYKKSKVIAKISASDGKKDYPFGEQEIAIGIITTDELVTKDEMPLLAYPLQKGVSSIQDQPTKTSYKGPKNLTQDMFDLNLPLYEGVDVLFLKNKSNLRNSQKRSKQIRDFKNLLKEFAAEDKQVVSAEIIGSASPEGSIDLNTNLSQSRAEQTKSFYSSLLKNSGLNLSNQVEVSKKDEDWEGFENLVNESDLKEKELVLSILNSYSDLNQREVELKKMTKTFIQLEKSILPQLRNSNLQIGYMPKAKSDDEINNLAVNNPSALNSEELLYAIHKMDNIDDQISTTQKFIDLNPKDWRGYNNMGYFSLKKGNVEKASASIAKAKSLTSSNAIIENNMGIIHRWNGDIKNAKKSYSDSKSYGETGKEVNYNQGIISIIEGDYETATSKFGEAPTLNNELLHILNRDFEAASALEDKLSSQLKNSPLGTYLSAIVDSNLNKTDEAKAKLASLQNSDSNLFERGKTDLEFSFNR